MHDTAVITMVFHINSEVWRNSGSEKNIVKISKLCTILIVLFWDNTPNYLQVVGCIIQKRNKYPTKEVFQYDQRKNVNG